MNTDLVDSMNIDQSLIFEHDDNEIILEVNEEDAQRLLSETDTPAQRRQMERRHKPPTSPTI